MLLVKHKKESEKGKKLKDDAKYTSAKARIIVPTEGYKIESKSNISRKLSKLDIRSSKSILP